MVWRFVDGKAGHENQSLGLVNALAALLPLEVHPVAVRGGPRDWLGLLRKRCPADPSLPAPDLLIGAGHHTHAAMLACRRSRGGRAVVLMRPSLPITLFDLCLIPEHDAVDASERVLLTRGVLNAVRPETHKNPQQGLILVGGPSAHYDWDQAALCDRIAEIAQRDPRHWMVATSRRTPEPTLGALQALAAPNLEVVPFETTAPGWLAAQLAPAAAVWVTEDSVSMLYEALTAGAACGALPIPARRQGRVRAGLARLVEEGAVSTFETWQRSGRLAPPGVAFDEAARCARWIRDRWYGA